MALGVAGPPPRATVWPRGWLWPPQGPSQKQKKKKIILFFIFLNIKIIYFLLNKICGIFVVVGSL
jgi:hypothetical protein